VVAKVAKNTAVMSHCRMMFHSTILQLAIIIFFVNDWYGLVKKLFYSSISLVGFVGFPEYQVAWICMRSEKNPTCHRFWRTFSHVKIYVREVWRVLYSTVAYIQSHNVKGRLFLKNLRLYLHAVANTSTRSHLFSCISLI